MTEPVLNTAFVVKVDPETGRIPDDLIPTSVNDAAVAAQNAATAAGQARDATVVIRDEAADLVNRARKPKVIDIDAAGDISDDNTAHTKALFGNGEWRVPTSGGGPGGPVGIDDVTGLAEALADRGFLVLGVSDPVPEGTPPNTVIVRSASVVPTPPGSPSGLASSSVTQTSFTFSWSAVAGATGYEWRRDSGSATAVSGLSVNITGRTAGSSNTMQVRAVNGAGVSAWATLVVTTLPTVPVAPGAPSGLAASSVTQTGFTFSWGAVSGATSYEWRRDGGSTTTISGTSAAVSGRPAGSSNSMQVRAVNSAGYSAWSTLVVETLPTAPVAPATPTGLASSAITTTGFRFSWAAVAGATSYQWAVGGGSPTTVTGLFVDRTGLTPNTSYDMEVRAINSAGASDWAVLTVDTLEPTPTEPVTVFGASAPPGTYTAYNDGAGVMAAANAFYVAAAGPAVQVLGVRLWIPAGATGAVLTEQFTALAWEGTFPTTTSVAPTWGSPTRSKAHTATRTAGTWTEVLFDTPLTLNPGGSGGTFVWLGYRFATNQVYVHSASPGATVTPSPDLSTLYLAETGFYRSANSAAGTVPDGPMYGIDIIVEAP